MHAWLLIKNHHFQLWAELARLKGDESPGGGDDLFKGSVKKFGEILMPLQQKLKCTPGRYDQISIILYFKRFLPKISLIAPAGIDSLYVHGATLKKRCQSPPTRGRDGRTPLPGQHARTAALNQAGLCLTHESWIKFDSTLTQMSWVRVESALKIRNMSRVRVESRWSRLSQTWVNRKLLESKWSRLILWRKNVMILLRAKPKAERVLAEYENLRQVQRPDRPTDRHALQILISLEPSYRLTNGFRHMKATFNLPYVLA